MNESSKRRLISCFIAAMMCGSLPLVNAASGAEVAWQKDIQKAVNEAARRQRPLVLMFTQKSCGHCHRMLRETFGNPAVAARLNGRFIPVLVDADEQPAFSRRLGIDAFPTVLVVNPDRRVVGRLTGFQSAGEMDSALASVQMPEAPAATPFTAQRPTIPTGRDFHNPFAKGRSASGG